MRLIEQGKLAQRTVIALVIEAIRNTLSSRKVRVAKSGGSSSSGGLPSIEYDAKCEAEITHLNVVLRLLCVREQACGERAHLRQGCDLIGQLMHRDIVVLGARHQEYVLCQPGREASCLVFLIVLHHLIRRVEHGVVHALLHCPVQEQALGHSVGEECVTASSLPASIQSRSPRRAGGGTVRRKHSKERRPLVQ